MSLVSDPPREDIVILDVGHGNASFIHEGCTTVLIDAAKGAHVREYLRQQNIRAIDLVILSHADEDHIGGLIGLLSEGIRIKQIFLSSDSCKNTQTWDDLAVELDRRARIGDVAAKVGLQAGGVVVDGLLRFSVEIVVPTVYLALKGAGSKDRAGKSITSNSISACVRVLFDSEPVALLAGDIDEVALDEAIHANADMKAPLLVFPHHGGRSGSGDAGKYASRLLDAVDPTSVVFSIGRGKHLNPRPEILAVIRSRNVGIRVACTQLSKNCAKDVRGESDHLAPIYAAGLVTKSCCAGSIKISPSPAAISLPTLELHSKFVAMLPTAMCR